MTNDELVQEYAERIAPLLPLAKRAYGSRDTVSPQHDASREYTRLLCEFYKSGGSLLDLAGALGVTYAGMRRRITTADVSPQSKHPRQKYTDSQYSSAVTCILECKDTGTADYHVCLKNHYDLGYSMARIAREMGLSSASPLYYGVYRIKIEGS